MRALIEVVKGSYDDLPASDDELKDLVEIAMRHRVDGLIDIDNDHVRSAMTLDQRSSLAGQVLRTEHRRSRLDQSLASLLRALDDMDVSVMILKGWWTSHEVHDDPAQRQFTDLDVWVDPGSPLSIGEIAARLRPETGIDAQSVDRSLDADLMHNYSVVFEGSLVELHKNPYGLKVDPPSLDELWELHARPAEHEGHRLYQPSIELGLLVACVNYLRDCFPVLYQLVDTYKLTQHDELDTAIFWQLCRSQSLEGFAHASLDLVSDMFGVEPLAGAKRPWGWRGWWTARRRVLRDSRPLGARLPAILLMPGGVRHTVRISREWFWPSNSTMGIYVEKYRMDPDTRGWRRIVELHSKRISASRSRRPVRDKEPTQSAH